MSNIKIVTSQLTRPSLQFYKNTTSEKNTAPPSTSVSQVLYFGKVVFFPMYT